MSARIRKAWLVKVRGYDGRGDILFAASAGKARYAMLLRLQDVGSEASFCDIRVRRERVADVRLPAPDPITIDLSDREKHCLLHAYGFHSWEPEKAGYRDHYCTTPDDPPLVRLTELSLMKNAGQGTSGHGHIYFLLTETGRHAALSLVPEYAP